MSIYSIIGVVLLLISATSFFVVKVILRRQRQKIDGLHGFAYTKEEHTKTDDWEDL